MAGVGGLAASFSSPSVATHAESTTSYTFENEAVDPIGSEEISANVSTSAITDNSQTFKVTFNAAIRLYNNGRYNNVWVKITDPAFDETTATADAQAAIEAVKNGDAETFEPATYDCSVYKILYDGSTQNKTPRDIVIPEFINYASTDLVYPDGSKESTFYFRFHVTSIEPEVVFRSNTTLKVDWSNIDSITIPSSVETIAAGAFNGAAEAGASIYCAPTASDLNSEENPWSVDRWAEKAWAEGWTDTDKVYYDRTFQENVPYADLGRYYVAPANSNFDQLGLGQNYLLSCHPTEEAQQENKSPFILEYRFVGDTVTYYEELPLFSNKFYYDGIGSSIGSVTQTYSIDIPLSKGQEIDSSSLIFHNIHVAKKIDGGYAPDFTESYYLVPRIVYTNPVRFSNIIKDYSLSGVSTFFNFTDIKMKFTLEESAFQTLKASSYAARQSDIANGTLKVRYQFSSISQSSYLIQYKGADGASVEKSINITTPLDAVSIVDGGDYGFLIDNAEVGEDFKAESITSLQLIGFTLHLDLYNEDKNSISNNSKFEIRFASLSLISPQSEVKPVSVVTVFVVSSLIYVVAFAALAAGLYFYRKNRYKNDEFRRVNGKKYLVESIKNFFGFALILFAVLCCVARWGILKNSIVTFNPIDPGVIIFVILGAIFFGFTIRNLVVSIKLGRERRRYARLRLGEDVTEDGTK